MHADGRRRGRAGARAERRRPGRPRGPGCPTGGASAAGDNAATAVAAAGTRAHRTAAGPVHPGTGRPWDGSGWTGSRSCCADAGAEAGTGRARQSGHAGSRSETGRSRGSGSTSWWQLGPIRRRFPARPLFTRCGAQLPIVPHEARRLGDRACPRRGEGRLGPCVGERGKGGRRAGRRFGWGDRAERRFERGDRAERRRCRAGRRFRRRRGADQRSRGRRHRRPGRHRRSVGGGLERRASIHRVRRDAPRRDRPARAGSRSGAPADGPPDHSGRRLIPKPRSISSAVSPSPPRAGSRPSWVAAA